MLAAVLRGHGKPSCKCTLSTPNIYCLFGGPPPVTATAPRRACPTRGPTAVAPSTGEYAATPTTPPPPGRASGADTAPGMRPIHEPFQALGLIPGQPGMQRLPRHPNFVGNLRHTHSHRRSPPTRPDPSVRPRSTPSSRECQGLAETTVKHQPKHCQASTEAKTSNINRRHTLLLWGGRARTRDLRIMSPRLKPTQLPPLDPISCEHRLRHRDRGYRILQRSARP